MFYIISYVCKRLSLSSSRRNAVSALQKFAWFNLAIILLTLVAVLSLAPYKGEKAVAGFGLTGLLGFGSLFLRKKRGQVVLDERDQLIKRRSYALAHTWFWVVFVLAAVFSARLYGANGAIPVPVVQNSVWCGFLLMYTVLNVAILVQYAGGRRDAE
jgi:hypothetical protein